MVIPPFSFHSYQFCLRKKFCIIREIAEYYEYRQSLSIDSLSTRALLHSLQKYHNYGKFLISGPTHLWRRGVSFYSLFSVIDPGLRGSGRCMLISHGFPSLNMIKIIFSWSLHERGTDCFQCKPISVIGIQPEIERFSFVSIFIIRKIS